MLKPKYLEAKKWRECVAFFRTMKQFGITYEAIEQWRADGCGSIVHPRDG